MFDFGGGGSKRDDSKLGFGVPSLSLGNSREALGKATNTLRNTGEKVENFLFGHHGSRVETHAESSARDDSKLGFGVPSLSLGNSREALGKATNTLRNTGEKVENFLFGHHGSRVETHAESSGRDDSKLGFGVPSLSLGNSREALGKATNTLRNTGEKVENFLFGHHGSRAETHTESSRGGFGLGGKSGLSLGFNVPSLAAPNLPKVSKLPKSNHGFDLPSLSNIGRGKNDLEKVGSGIENTGKKAIDFLFGGRQKTPSLPGLGINAGNPSVPPNGISLNGNLGSVKANATSLGVSLGKGKPSIGASLTLPNLTGVGSKMKNDLGKVALENTGEKAIDFLFGHEKGDSLPGIDLNVPSIPSLGITLGSGNLGLPNLSKGNLTIKHNLENVTPSPGLSLDIQKGNLDASVPSLGVKINGTSTGNLGSINANGTSLGISLGNGKSSIGASLSLPNLSAPTNNLNKVGDAIENTGKKAIHFLPSLSTSSPDTATSNKQKGTTNIPVDSTLEGNVNGSIGLPRLPLGEKSSTPAGSDEKSIGLLELNLPKLGGPVLVDLGSTKAENTYTNIPLSILPNLSSTVDSNEGALPGTPPEILTTTDQPFTATLNPLFEGLDKIFYTNNISTIDDGTTSFGSTNEDEIAETDYEEYDISTYNYDKATTSTEDSSNFSESSEPINTSTETHSIFNGNGNGFSIPYNITTESEKDLKKIEEILRGSLDANLPTSSSNLTATRKKENHVTTKTQTRTPTTESIEPVQSTTLEYSSDQTSTTARPKKTKPAVIPPYFLVPNSNVTFGEGSEPVLPPSVFDNPTGEKAPFIPILPSSPTNHMGPYNLTDRGGVNSNPSESSTPDNLSAVTYGAIGVGAIAIISIIIAFIYKAIKKARRSSSGGSYSPKSHHKEQEETRRSSSNSEGNEGNSAVVDSQEQQTIIAHAVINETTAEGKKIIRNGKSRAPDPQRKQNEILHENTDQSDLNHPEPSNTEVLNFEKTYDPEKQSEKIQQQDSTKKELPTSDEVIIHEQNILKKNIIPIDKPPRKIDKANASTGKFTSDKTAASNLNEDSLRSLGQALGGILKDQMPELDGNHKVGTGNIKKGKDFANDSDELTSCTPPTTPTDLSDQETTKNDHKVEENKTQKKSNVAGGEVDGDGFFSSGEMEVDTGSEYFSAEESNYGVKESNVRSPPVASNFQGTYSNSTLSKENGFEFVTEEGRRKSIEEDIADSLKISTKSQEKMVTIDAVKMAGHQRCISMCEDRIIDMEVQEILKGKEPYQLPSENSSLKGSANSAEFQTYNQKEMDDKHIVEEIFSKNTTHLQKIIDSGTPSNQNNSGLDANTVVDEIMSTSKLDFLDTELGTSGKTQNIETEGTKVHLEENVLNMKNSNLDFFIQSKTTILDVEISGETFSKINDETSKTTDTPEQRNLIDYIVPKPASIETASFDGCNPSRVDQRIDEGLGATSIRENESTTNTPKWYVPFESSPQELTDPSRGNSDGLYIALSDETKLPQIKTENQTQDLNSTSGVTKMSCAYININGDRGAIDEGWPSHLPKNHHENNMSGLGLLNTVSPNGHRCIIHEEPTQVSSNKRGKTYNEISDLLSRQAEISITNSTLTGEKSQEEIPNFELPNMDKRLTRRRNLKRRQIKSLDSGVHGYYGEYIDLVEFPDLEGGRKMTHDEEQKTNGDNANKNEILDREVKEIKIEEDVVTILPDGSILEEKIVIDKIRST